MRSSFTPLLLITMMIFSIVGSRSFLPDKSIDEQHNAVGISEKSKYSLHDLSICSTPNGIITETSMESEVFQAPVKYSIYLPPCYTEQEGNRYPVLYLLHGQTYDHTQWGQLGLAQTADELINSHQISPLIIILPNDPDWRQPGETLFGRMLINEMVPFVDTTYPTLAERDYRAIGGLSRGASWALHLGLTEWDTFSRVGMHSLPVFVSDLSNVPVWLDEIPSQLTPEFYIDMGNQDPELNIARNVESHLSARHIPHEWHLFIGSHDESYWRRHIEKYLLWYACEWTVLYYN